ncbi:MAG: hypothetical protein ABR508_10590 [Candidatus Baltobacteraceae bacterium]
MVETPENARAELQQTEYDLKLVERDIADAERQLQFLREKRAIIASNIELRQRLVRQLESMASVHTSGSGSNHSAAPRAPETFQDAVFDVLKAAGGRRMTAEDIEAELRGRGFTTAAKSPVNAVRNALNNLKLKKKPIRRQGRGYWRWAGSAMTAAPAHSNGRPAQKQPPGRYGSNYKRAGDALREVLLGFGASGAKGDQLIEQLKAQGYLAGSNNPDKSLATLIYQQRQEGRRIDTRPDGTFALMTEEPPM